MFETTSAVMTFLLLAPGFLSLQIIEWLAPIKKESLKNKLVSALALSLLIYILYQSLAPWLGIQATKISATAGPLSEDSIFSLDAPLSFALYGLDFGSLLAILVLSIVTGALFALVLEKGWLFEFLSLLRISYATGRASVWNDVFSTTRRKWAQIYLEDGTTVLGDVLYYSDDPEEPMLFVRRAQIWHPGAEKPDVVDGPGILLVSPKIEYIQFRDGKKEK